MLRGADSNLWFARMVYCGVGELLAVLIFLASDSFVELSTPRHSKASEGRGEGIREELVSLHH